MFIEPSIFNIISLTEEFIIKLKVELIENETCVKVYKNNPKERNHYKKYVNQLKRKIKVAESFLKEIKK